MPYGSFLATGMVLVCNELPFTSKETGSMASSALKIPELFPQPKVIEKLGGDSDFSMDVRLVTSNVQPLQRKAIRSILTSEGVRVVANKKKYVVNVMIGHNL